MKLSFPGDCMTVFHFPGGSDGKSIRLPCGRPGFDPWVRKILWRRKWQPTPVFLPGESHGWRSLVGYSPRVTKSWTQLSDFTFTFTFSHSEGCLFTLLIVSFAVQKLLSLIRSHLFTFVFISNILGGGS